MTQKSYISGVTESAKWWIGVVIDRGIGKYNDPDGLMNGRVRVKIYGTHDDVKKENIQFAHVMTPTTSASVSGVGYSPIGISEETICFGIFIDGASQQEPLVLGTLPHVQLKKKETTQIA